jgi:ribosome-associated translation inhibitor RaiA
MASSTRGVQSPETFLKEEIMVIHVRTRGFSLSDALRHHVENCLAAAMRPFGRAVSSVTARLTDINAGRGGNDKQCRLVAVLPHRHAIVTEGLHADAYISIEQSSGRMRRAISRALGRQARRGRRATIRLDAIDPTAPQMPALSQ